MSAVLPTAAAAQPLRATASDRVAHVALALVAAVLLLFLAGPLLAILQQSVQDAEGRFVAVANFVSYAKTPALLQSLWNSLWVSAAVSGEPGSTSFIQYIDFPNAVPMVAQSAGKET